MNKKNNLSYENVIPAIKKFIDNYVFENSGIEYDYSIRFDEKYKKLVLSVDITVDIKRFLETFPEYDFSYANKIYNVVDEIENSLKYFGLSFTDLTFFINFDYIGQGALIDEASELQKEINEFYGNNTDIWADIRLTEESSPYAFLEVGTQDTSYFKNNDIDFEEVQWQVEDIILKSEKYPHLKNLIKLSDIEFWWNY